MIDSQTAAGLLLFASLIGLALVYLFASRRRRRVLSSGREIARCVVPAEERPMKASLSFHISEANRWCRVAADFAMTESVWESNSVFAKLPSFSRFHRFVICISDYTGNILIDRAASFYEFLGVAQSRVTGWSIPFKGDRSRRSLKGEVILFEFLPASAGSYELGFEFLSGGNFLSDHYRRQAEFERFVLTIREDVVPAEQAAYRHQRVKLPS